MSRNAHGQIGVTIGICAYNEEQNIRNLLEALSDQRTAIARVDEILVVASGCTDQTQEIVAAFQNDHGTVRLVVEEERRGKASAINEILRQARGEVVVLEGADTLPHPDAVESITRPFIDSSVGVVAARPISADHKNTFWGGLAHTLWELHHLVSLQDPKPGEMFAFRRVLESLPPEVGADEDWIRHAVESDGYRVMYQPGARVYNSGPKSINEFLKQRVRIRTQQLFQSKVTSYIPPTGRARLLASALLAYLRSDSARPTNLLTLMGLETLAWFYSVLSLVFKRENIVSWDPLPSTKAVVSEQNLDEDRKP